jgi:hypothetical protein
LSCAESVETTVTPFDESGSQGENPWNTGDQQGADATIIGGSQADAGTMGSGAETSIASEPGMACPDPEEIAKLETCCDGGEGRCVPDDMIPAAFGDVVGACVGGGLCVPDKIIMSLATTAAFDPKPCKSILGADGRCLSTCVPEVNETKDLLPVDVCEANERCTPCINPLNNEDTGICGANISCGAKSNGGDNSNAAPEPEPEPTDPCENPPSESPIPLNTLNVCCPGAHCLPQAIVEAMQPGASNLLAGCDGGTGLCVPDQNIATGGLVPPKTCTSVGGSEGRCLSTCVPAVAEKADNLPQSVCDAGELCSPCCDPFTGQSTGACDTTCDPGPSQVCNGVPLFETCCGDGKGHCLDKESIPDDQENKLHEKYCQNDSQLCVPDVLQDKSWKGSPCIGHPVFGDPYQGVCLPQCLKLPEFFMDANACPEHYICAQCKGPFGGDTGAPGCPGT